MGQVPIPTYGIIGDGRVAKHFSNYFSLCGVSFKSWSRKSQEQPSELLKDCDTILILISDSQIEVFLKDNFNWLKSKLCVHFSGSLSLQEVSGFHPLMTFGSNLYDLETYEKITFIGEKDALPFKEVFPALQK